MLIKAIKLDCNLHINTPGFFTLFNLHKTLGSYKGTGSLIEHTFLVIFDKFMLFVVEDEPVANYS